MKHFIFTICLLTFFSCASQKREVIAKSTTKLESKNTNIRDLIEIDGFYYCPPSQTAEQIIFFEDGTAIKFLLNMQGKENVEFINFFDYVNSWVKNKQIRWSFKEGVYITKNDTIIAYIYDKPHFYVSGWSLEEEKYKIIDRKTIKRISTRGLLKYEEFYSILDGYPLKFKPVNFLPSSDCWLKEEKWIWRNESDWKAYMEKVKQIKKQYKKK